MRYIHSIIAIAIISLSIFSCQQGPKPRGQWTVDQAKAWGENQPWISGCNYVPANAINSIEMWSAETYDHALIDKELGQAEELGFNSMRVFLSSIVWNHDPAVYKKTIDDFLGICDSHGIRAIFVLLDDCWNAESAYGKQPEPKPGVHNSGWAQDPPVSSRADTTTLFKNMEAYVKDIIGSFRMDERILFWDLYNEPGNEKHGDTSLPLLKHLFEWGRECGPVQPLSSGIWSHSLPNLNKFQLENSDIISYHCYGAPEAQQHAIDTLKRFNRPMVNTEYMARRNNCTFANTMPLLKKNNVGAINWGFVAGKTNTNFAWGEPMPDMKEPPVWFHDILRQDGTPFDPEEITVIKKCNGK